ncbi:MAG: 16S rRNA (adenine(1518)-N(6)/adenine(1519)-N(6))-dimethyltransferase RsmA [Bacilli bacterium]
MSSYNFMTNALLKKTNFHFKKKFGQNFIFDENILKSIVERSDIKSNSLVIEIGPGAGGLTRFLATKAKKVLCYEIDLELKPILLENLKLFDNIEIIYDDFLKRNINKDIKINYDNIYMIANLPYYITTPIITKIINDNIKINEIVIMVQKEVGQRFMASPGQKSYNSLTIFLDYYFEIKKLFNVSKNVFFPKPKIDSMVISLKRRDKLKLVLKDENLFFDLVRDAFKYKRKNLRNNLRKYNLKVIEDELKKHNLDLMVRAENLSIEQLGDISNKLKSSS